MNSHYFTKSIGDNEEVAFGKFRFRLSPTITKSLQWAAISPVVVHGTSEALYAAKQTAIEIRARAVTEAFAFIHPNLTLRNPGNIQRVEFFDEETGVTYSLVFMLGKDTHRLRISRIL